MSEIMNALAMRMPWMLSGIVNLGTQLTDSSHEERPIPLPQTPVPAGNHRLRRTRLSSLCLSFRDVEDVLAECGIIVSCEAIRRCAGNSDPAMPDVLRRKRRLEDALYLDKLFVRIKGQQQYLWRAGFRTVMSSIFCCSLAAIGVQPNDSFADCCVVKAKSHCG